MCYARQEAVPRACTNHTVHLVYIQTKSDCGRYLQKYMEDNSRIACELLSQRFPELRIPTKISANKKINETMNKSR